MKIVLMCASVMLLSGCITHQVWRPDHPDGREITETRPENVVASVSLGENDSVVRDVIVGMKGKGDDIALMPESVAEIDKFDPNEYSVVRISEDGVMKWHLHGNCNCMHLKGCDLGDLSDCVRYPVEVKYREVRPVNKYDVVPTVGRVVITPVTFVMDLIFTPIAVGFLVLSGFHG